jgi:hypothetical protein
MSETQGKTESGNSYVNEGMYEPETTGSLLELRYLANGYTAVYGGNLI